MFDVVITACDQAAAENCPVWPGRPAQAHWSARDPAVYMDDPEHAERIIRDVFVLMQRRISLLTSLPPDKLDRVSLQAGARAIARKSAGTEQARVSAKA